MNTNDLEYKENKITYKFVLLFIINILCYLLAMFFFYLSVVFDECTKKIFDAVFFISALIFILLAFFCYGLLLFEYESKDKEKKDV